MSIALAVVAIALLVRTLVGLQTSNPLAELVAAVNGADQEAVRALLVSDDAAWIPWFQFLIATEAELTLSGCRTSTTGVEACNARFGSEWFHNRAAPPAVARLGALASVVSVEVEGNRVGVVAWPLPEGLLPTEEAFRTWVVAAHPESAEQMWSPPAPGQSFEDSLRLDRAGGLARMALLDDYLLSVNQTLLRE